MFRCLRNTAPTLSTAVAGSIAWSLAMAASAAFSLWLNGRTATPVLTPIVILFAIGGFAAFVPALTLANLFGSNSGERRFAAAFVSLCILTIGITAMLYALHFRYYFSQWHAEPFTVRWAFEFGFTIAAALYQFAVLGLRLYFPLGLLALFAFSLWNANRSR